MGPWELQSIAESGVKCSTIQAVSTGVMSRSNKLFPPTATPVHFIARINQTTS